MCKGNNIIYPIYLNETTAIIIKFKGHWYSETIANYEKLQHFTEINEYIFKFVAFCAFKKCFLILLSNI